MSKPITVNGVDYLSVEAMPPAARAAYDADMKEFNDAMADAGLDPATGDAVAPAWGGAGKPAWGGARPEGAVPVPLEFDAVTGLGPATQVYASAGVKLLPNFGAPRPSALVRYRDGLAYRAGGKEVHTLRWEEVAAILSNLTIHASSQGLGLTTHEYTLLKPNGDKLILDDGLQGVHDAAESIKAAVYALLRPALTERYQSGAPLAFGAVTVERQNGLTLDGKRYAWDSIQDVKVTDGRLKLTMRDGKKHEARTATIPNIELLCQLIGVPTLVLDLTYI